MIVDGKPWHCGEIARRLRKGHREVLDGMKVRTHRELRQAFDGSIWCKSWFREDRLMAMAGITGTVGSAEGSVWLALSDEATKHPIALVKAVLGHMDEMFTTKRRLTTIVLKDDREGVQFAYFLGFKVEQAVTINGAEAMIMALERKSRQVA